MKLLFEFDIDKKKIVFFGNGFEISRHNKEYLLVCYANLYEKHNLASASPVSQMKNGNGSARGIKLLRAKNISFRR